MLKRLKYLWALALLIAGCSTAPSQTGDAAGYDSLKALVANQQLIFRREYKKAAAGKKDSIIKAAAESVFKFIVNDYFSFWYNTPWEFYGTTRTPKKGAIACGYFITTVLEDAGFNIPRVKWAQVASETMIKAMTTDLKRFSDKPVADLENYIKNKGKGLYVVGLDNHTGFIYNDGENIRFVHSNYYKPATGVMAQPLDSENPLKNSKYRVVGKILDAAMMKHWILGTKMQ